MHNKDEALKHIINSYHFAELIKGRYAFCFIGYEQALVS